MVHVRTTTIKKCIAGLALLGFLSLSPIGQAEKLKSTVVKWASIPEAGAGHFSQVILEGSGHDFRQLNIRRVTLLPGKKIADRDTQFEEVIIVKEGSLDVSLGGAARALGPGSVVVTLPGEQRELKNQRKTPSVFYQLNFIAKQAPDHKRGQQAGGSILVDWNDLQYKKSPIGGRRQNFDRSSTMFEHFEMHVSTLHSGATNHPMHTHGTEEIMIMLKGNVVMLVDHDMRALAEGDLIFVETMVPHTIFNSGDTEAIYFAFQFWQ